MENANLDQIENLLTHSLKGVHYLFDNESIASILQIPTEDLDFFSLDNMDKIQLLFTELINQKSFREQVDFLKNLEPDSYEILLRTYFHILDNTLLASMDHPH